MIPSGWKPVNSGDIIRVGSVCDGGYVVSKTSILASEGLISMGIGDNWTFEEEYRILTNSPIIAIDPTVNRNFWIRWYFQKFGSPNRLARSLRNKPSDVFQIFRFRSFFGRKEVEHVQKWVGYECNNNATSLEAIMGAFERSTYFLKVDVEGAEYRILEDICRLQNRFTGVVIEFHDIDLHRHRLSAFIANLKDHVIVNVHANNGGGRDLVGDPLILEISWVRKDLHVDSTPEDYESFIERLNSPNILSLPDMILRFELTD